MLRWGIIKNSSNFRNARQTKSTPRLYTIATFQKWAPIIPSTTRATSSTAHLRTLFPVRGKVANLCDNALPENSTKVPKACTSCFVEKIKKHVFYYRNTLEFSNSCILLYFHLTFLSVPSFSLEGFLTSANLPQDEKETLVKKYATLLTSPEVGITAENQLSLLTTIFLKELKIPLGHAAAIVEAAKSWGKKGTNHLKNDSRTIVL
jgi:hypothetical protein